MRSLISRHCSAIWSSVQKMCASSCVKARTRMQAVQRAGRLVAMHAAELGDLHRQVAIALEAVLEDLHVARAVHRLQREDALVLGLGDEHVGVVGLPVARRLPQRSLEELRRVDLDVAFRVLAAAHVGDQPLEQRPALRVPEHRARRVVLEMEQVHLAAELAVVALLGFLELLEVGGELLLVAERGAVDALELRALRIAAPVGAREASAA